MLSSWNCGLYPAGGIDACCVCCTVEKKEQARSIKTKKQVRKSTKRRTSEKKPRPVYRDFLMDKVAVGSFLLVSPIRPLFHTHISFIYHGQHTILANDNIATQNTSHNIYTRHSACVTLYTIYLIGFSHSTQLLLLIWPAVSVSNTEPSSGPNKQRRCTNSRCTILSLLLKFL
jgi:hypothetical protein